MAGRHRASRQYYYEPQEYHDGPLPPVAQTRPLSLGRLEKELSSRRAKMRKIHEDNQRLADEIVSLRQTMPRLKEDLHVSNQAVPKLRAQKELEFRELTQRNLKLEAELRALEPLRQDALHLRSEAGKLQSLRQELATEVQGLLEELEHKKSESQKITAMVAERDALRQELFHARENLEFEKKAKLERTAEVQAMGKDLVAMAQEAEKQRADIEKRSTPSFSCRGTYGPCLSTPGMGLQGMNDGGGYPTIGSHYGSDAGARSSHDTHVVQLNHNLSPRPIVVSNNLSKIASSSVEVSENGNKKVSKYLQPRWCPPGLSHSQKRRLQRLRKIAGST